MKLFRNSGTACIQAVLEVDAFLVIRGTTHYSQEF
jgi:hypothetical protein